MAWRGSDSVGQKTRQEALGADLRQDPNLGPLLLGPGPRPVLSVSVVLWAEGLRTLSSQVQGPLTLSLVLTTHAGSTVGMAHPPIILRPEHNMGFGQP